MRKLIDFGFYFGVFISLTSIIVLLATYFVYKPNLPEIKYVDESQLQISSLSLLDQFAYKVPQLFFDNHNFKLREKSE